MAVLLRIHIFWDVVLCHLGMDSLDKKNSAFIFKSQEVQESLGRFLLDYLTLKMRVVGKPETENKNHKIPMDS